MPARSPCARSPQLRPGHRLFAGELEAAASLVEEVEAVTEATWGRVAPFAALALAAFQGREAQAAELIDATVQDAMFQAQGMGATVIQWASAARYDA
jgi:hypothetical protein